MHLYNYCMKYCPDGIRTHAFGSKDQNPWPYQTTGLSMSTEGIEPTPFGLKVQCYYQTELRTRYRHTGNCTRISWSLHIYSLISQIHFRSQVVYLLAYMPVLWLGEDLNSHIVDPNHGCYQVTLPNQCSRLQVDYHKYPWVLLAVKRELNPPGDRRSEI